MKSYFYLFITLFLVNVSFAQTKLDTALEAIKGKDFNKADKIAQEYLSQDSTSQALKLYMEITLADTTNKAAYEGIGDVYNKMGVDVLALSNYGKAEKLDSTNAKLKYKIAKILIKQQSYTDAANKLLQVIKIDPKFTKAYFDLGYILYFAKQYPNASFYLEKYIALNPKNYDAYLYTASSFYSMANFTNSYAYADSGLIHFPNDLKLEKIAAMALIQAKKYDDAMTVFNKIPDSLFTGSELAQAGYILENGKKDSLAVLLFSKALKRDSSLTDLYTQVADILLSTGKYDSAIVYYNKKIQIDPKSVSSYVNKGLCDIQLKKYEDAKESLAKAVQIKNDYLPALIWLARSYRLQDSTSKAIEVYKNILDLTKGNEVQNKSVISEAYGFMGYAELVKKRYKPAIESLKECLEYDKDNAQYHLWLAQAYALSGKHSSAIKEYKVVLSIDPKNADAKKGLKILGE